MKTTIISYSLSGNNQRLAAHLAQKTGANHIELSEPKKRTMGRIALDRVLGRCPKINESLESAFVSSLIIFVGPVWMYAIASPLRTAIKKLRHSDVPYVFVSVSGGADGPESNKGLTDELTKRMNRAPKAIMDLHIAAHLLPSDPKPTRDDTSNYKLTDTDIELFGRMVLERISVESVESV